MGSQRGFKVALKGTGLLLGCLLSRGYRWGFILLEERYPCLPREVYSLLLERTEIGWAMTLWRWEPSKVLATWPSVILWWSLMLWARVSEQGLIVLGWGVRGTVVNTPTWQLGKPEINSFSPMLRITCSQGLQVPFRLFSPYYILEVTSSSLLLFMCPIFFSYSFNVSFSLLFNHLS